MNVLHIDEQRGWRGGEQQASYLIQGLHARGHGAVVAGRRGSEFLRRDHGPPLLGRISGPFAGEADLYTAWKLARAIHDYDIDIIHAHTSHAHAHACLARAMARRGKVVVSRRVDVMPRKGRLNRWKYNAPDRIVAISNSIAEVLRAYGVSNERMSVVYSAIDPKRFDVPAASRADLGVPEDAPVIGNVAALEPHKDQLTLLEALPAVLERVPHVRVLIAGEGRMRRVLEERIAALGLQDVVTLLGYRRDVPALLHAMDVFVLTSRMEGLGTSLQDAMVCGLPVVATAAGGIPELVMDDNTGLLVPVGDACRLSIALTRVLTNSALAERLGQAGERMIREHFDVQAMIEGNMAVYEELMWER